MEKVDFGAMMDKIKKRNEENYPLIPKPQIRYDRDSQAYNGTRENMYSSRNLRDYYRNAA